MRKNLLLRREGHALLQGPRHYPGLKKVTLIVFLIITSVFIAHNASAQNSIKISGTVADSTGEALIGVGVSIKGTQTGTTTDVKGHFSLSVNDGNSVLVFSYIGYKPKEVPLNGQTILSVKMQSINSNLQEVVVTGYGTQKKESLTAAISSVTAKDIDRVHGASTVSRALAGKIPGLTFKASDGRPGSSASIQIRNMGHPLFVIDGIQTDEGQFNNIAPNDVESISILKDASAAIYGVRAANGVVVVTTKKGKGEASVNVDAYLGWQNFYRFPTALSNSYDYAYLRDEADVNDGHSPTYTQADLDKFKIGTDPAYRSYDWKKLIVDDNANSPQNFLNVNFQGAGDKVSYYASASNIYQESTLGHEYTFKRTNIQSNLQARLSSGLTVSFDINGRIEDRENPGVPNADDYDQARYAELRNTPLERPYANDNPDYLNDIGHNNSNYAYLNNKLAGHQSDVWRILTTKFQADYKIPGIKGLTLTGLYDYYFADHLLNNFEYTFKAYTYRPETNTYDVTGGSTNPYRQRIQGKVFNTTSQILLHYDNSFGKSSIAATFVAERYTVKNINATIHSVPISNNLPLIYFPTADSYDDSESEEARLGYVARITYNYDNKYYAEFSGRRDQSYLFAPGHRTGYFPGGSVGWRITEEKWMKSLLGDKGILDNFKLRASYGILGDDRDPNGNPIVPAFAYLPGYNYNQGIAILDGNAVTSAADKGLPTTSLSWTKSKITDVGADFSLFNNHLNGTFDYFYRKRTGLPAGRYDVLIPSELGYTLPSENLNSDAQYGEEFSLSYNNKIGELSYNVGGNIAYSRSKTLELYKDAQRYSNALDQYRNSGVNRYARIDWGYIVEGQFTSQDQINNYKTNIDGKGNTTLLPGDLIYKDVNGDGKIDANDVRPIGFGNGQPNINFGFTFGVAYKNFAFNADFSGGAGYSYYQTNELQVPFTNNGNLNTIFQDRWHHQDPFDVNSPWIPGRFPANRYNNSTLSNYTLPNINGDGTMQGGIPNTFWGHNVFYLRARTLELSYTLPASLLAKIKIKKARFYVNGYNLFSFDNLKAYEIDPELTDSNGEQVPQTKVVNIGVNLSL